MKLDLENNLNYKILQELKDIRQLIIAIYEAEHKAKVKVVKRLQESSAIVSEIP